MCYVIYDSSDDFIKVFSSLKELVVWLDSNNNYDVDIYYVNFITEFLYHLETISKYKLEV